MVDDVYAAPKNCARILHKQIQNQDGDAFARLRKLPDFKTLPDDDIVETVKRRHCLTVIAREQGFRNWGHLTAVVSGTETRDFGKLLSPPRCRAHFNIWSASWEEASSIRAENNGYLLAYQSQFLVVDADYIRTLGLDPQDQDWELIKHDWPRPADLVARQRLYGKMFDLQKAA